MKKIFALALLLSITLADCAYAQPPRRRAEQQQKQEQQLNAPKGSSYRDFPTAQTMPNDAAWRRDLYRTIDLTNEENAVLYNTPRWSRKPLYLPL